MKRNRTTLPPLTNGPAVTTLSQTKDWGLINLKVQNIWSKTKGENIIVGVIDTGIPDHVDLVNNVIAGENFTTDKSPADGHGHQTHCVGIICGEDNDIGMVGVAPASKCLCVKGLSNTGSGSWTGLCNAIEYCIEQKVDLISMSLGGSSPIDRLEQVISRAVKANIPVICAAGNSGQSGVGYPGAYDTTIAVAAYDKSGKIAYFSSKGPEVDFAKPGVNIMSTYLGNKYRLMSGTSMATPYMAGVVALLLSYWKKLQLNYTVEDVVNALLITSSDRGAEGKDEDWGNGVVNVELLLNTIPGDKPKPTPTKPKPTPTKPKPTPTKPKPTPTKPKPTPTKPKPTPTPIDNSPSWFKKYIGWIMLTSFVIISTMFFLLSECTNTEIPKPPYIDDHGNVNWDDKFEYDTR